uniref:Uncharacterized protein n=1 Tax=Morchella importuna TaxID=1174673 RepID=A0A650AFD7_9PEZI|nr:hypothetical protein [Morchella importuna]QGN66752.1 hypothetical protein [Morchella importuna]
MIFGEIFLPNTMAPPPSSTVQLFLTNIVFYYVGEGLLKVEEGSLEGDNSTCCKSTKTLDGRKTSNMLFSNADNDRSDSGFEDSSSDEEEVAVTTAVNSVVKYAQEPNPHLNYPGDLPDLKDANLFNTAIIEADDSPSRIKASPSLGPLLSHLFP